MTTLADKVEILDIEKYDKDPTLLTVIFHNEDHTIGNALKHVICGMEGVEFCGYSIPHPLEDKVLVRIQTKPGYQAAEVLMTAMDHLDKIFETIKTKFQDAYENFQSERGQ